jgi:hypothetical protein
LQLEENGLKMDYPRVWTSTYTMLEQLLVRKGVMASVLDNIETVDRDAITLTEDEWKVVEDLVMVLEPFKVCGDLALCCNLTVIQGFFFWEMLIDPSKSCCGTQRFITTITIT